MVVVVVLAFPMVAGGCSMLGEDTTTSGAAEGRLTFEQAGFPTDSLSVLEGCTQLFRGLREGTYRAAVARADAADVPRLLEGAGVDPSHASSKSGDAQMPSCGASTFEVRVGDESESRAEGERLSHRDHFEYDGRSWERHIEWGEALDGGGYLILVMMEVGSM